ncbi:MAG: DUF2895 family protein, partial [Gammaproteobacteria bacterium]|nr:DUF2895 family protein [Gammaproteobacteria bacterium]
PPVTLFFQRFSKQEPKPVSGFAQIQNVTAISNGSWQVNLDVEIVETVDNQVVKDVIMQYPLQVSRADLPITSNPWGLVINGFASQPTRIQTNV